MNKLILGLFILVMGSSWAQQHVYLNITPQVAQQQLFLNDEVKALNAVAFSVEYFNYYLSDLHLIHDGGQDLDLSDSVFIIRTNGFRLDLGTLNVTQLEKVTFAVGVPQNLNHLDISQYPDKHPLSFQDPSMHWGWTDGYVFMVVGGKADSDGDNFPNAVYQVHSFGDANYFHVEVATSATDIGNQELEINLNCNLDEWLGTTDLATVGIKHGQTDVNATVLKNTQTRPVFTAAQEATINEIEFTGELQAHVQNENLVLVWKDLTNMDHLVVVDGQGKIVRTIASKQMNGSETLTGLKHGLYFVRCYSEKKQLIQRLKVTF